MLAIKLQPKGKKNQRHFHIVVMEKKSKLVGRYVDKIGWINPHESTRNIDKEKAEKWLQNGARPTDTVHNLLVSEGILKAKKIPVHSKKKVKEEKVKAPPAAEGAEEKPAESAEGDTKPEDSSSGTAVKGEKKEEKKEAKAETQPEEKSEKVEKVKEETPKEKEKKEPEEKKEG